MSTIAVEKLDLLNNYSVSNTCGCGYCEDCECITSYGDGECECGAELRFHDCYGDCVEEEIDLVDSVFAAWVAANPTVLGYLITGTNMGWRHRSGIKILNADADKIVQEISVNSEWTQAWTIEPQTGGKCQAVQSHHDSLGELYTIKPIIGPAEY